MEEKKMTQRIEKQFAGRTLTIETGRMARQAAGSALIQFGETVILVAATAQDRPTHLPFFPLTVEYQGEELRRREDPWWFFQEGRARPAEKEILSARLIDRPLRPMFPDGYMHETQVACFPLSADQENDADVWGHRGCIPCTEHVEHPLQHSRGCASGSDESRETGLLNPTFQQLEYSDVDIVVAGTEDALLMVEGGAIEVPEERIDPGVGRGPPGHQANSLKSRRNSSGIQAASGAGVDPHSSRCRPQGQGRGTGCRPKVKEALLLSEKQERNQAMAAVQEDILDHVGGRG